MAVKISGKVAYILSESPGDSWSATPKIEGIALDEKTAKEWVKKADKPYYSRTYGEVRIWES